jgi:glycosyltransferase involved in cell wall biosynthesis
MFTIENSGVSYARNFGIEQVTGKYLTFLDADDYYSEDFLKVIISEIQKNTQIFIYGNNIVREGRTYPYTITLKNSGKLRKQSEFREIVVSLIENEMLNAPWNKVYLTSYIKDNRISFPRISLT